MRTNSKNVRSIDRKKDGKKWKDTGGLLVFIEVGILHHEVAGDYRQREVDPHFGLAGLQLDTLCLVPHAWNYRHALILSDRLTSLQGGLTSEGGFGTDRVCS